MHQRPHLLALCVLTLMLLPMLACSNLLGGQESEQDVPSASEVTGTTAPQQDSEGETSAQGVAGVPDQEAEQPENGSDAIGAGGADDSAVATSIQPSLPFNNDALPFQSYQIRMQFSSLSSGQTSSVEMNIARDVATQAASYQMSVTGVPEIVEQGAGPVSLVAIDDTVYMTVDGDCMLAPSGVSNPVEQMWTRNNFLLMEDNLQVQLVGDQNVNGLPVKEYQLTGINAAEMLAASGMLHTYTLPDGQEVVIKVQITGTSAKNPISHADEESTINYTFELFAVDEPVTIIVPEDCHSPAENLLPEGTAEQVLLMPARGQASGDYPVYPGSDFIGGHAMGETYIIAQSTVDLAQIDPKDFYIQQFGNQGFTLEQELASSAGGAISLTFQKESIGTVQVMLVGADSDISITIVRLPDTP